MDRDTKAIAKWIRSKIGGDLRITRLTLRNSSIEGRSPPVDTFDLPREIESDHVDAIALDILERAQSDSDGIGGLNRYAILSHVGDDEKAIGRYTFKRHGSSEGDETGFGDIPEESSLRGVAAQLMRHNEALMRQAVGGFGSMLRVMSEQLNSANQRVLEGESLRVEYFKAREIAASEESDRDMALLRATGEQKRLDTIVEKASLLAPVIVNHVANKKVFGSAPDPQSLVFAAFVSSLSENQFSKIMGELTPEQQIAISQLVTQNSKGKSS